ncbi:DEAD/DEAH box helicase [Vibrio vulnificus]|nr:DEAD/DEAH box helicase [Vibrio vulnificus]
MKTFALWRRLTLETTILNNISPLDMLTPVYFPNESNIVANLFTPISKESKSFDCLSGYFSSKVFSELAEPLSILFMDSESKGRFLISPNLDDIDRLALHEAYLNKKSMLKYIFKFDEITPSELELTTLEAIKYLILNNKLDIKIVLMKEGMMHAKIWLFDTKHGEVAVHGSSNATKPGLMHNFEQLVLTRAWDSQGSNQIVEAFRNRFNEFWNGERDDSYSFSLNDETILDMLKPSNEPYEQVNNHSELITKLQSHANHMNEQKKLTTPEWLNYKEGAYSHQGKAINLWLENKRGTLEIATGGGKTLTALVCAAKAFQSEKNALLVIAVPNKPLIKQWGIDVEHFGIDPIDTEGVSSKKIRKLLKDLFRQQKYIPSHGVIVLTHDAIKNPDIISVLEEYSGKTMLIGDEAHNLGSRSFVDNPPEFFDYRLALSATPERQYDLEGSKKLFDFFGDVIFTYSLKEAIGNCLVPFDYYVHKVYLTQEEQDKWDELTDKINNLLWNQDDTETKKAIDLLRVQRRAISEGASNKINVFEQLISSRPVKNYSLVFCSSKGPKQIEDANSALRRYGYTFHQVTSKETSDKALMKTLVDTYSRGDIDVLTSKKVLDEGFNIPPIELAYFLASSNVKRTWVQRLGRVLRLSKSTNKEFAEIHDFLVLPTCNESRYKSLITSELDRLLWFHEHSRNGKKTCEANLYIQELIETLEVM